MQMSVLARWLIKPRLMSIPGVANVSVWGLRDRQLQVQVDPQRLQSRKVTLTQLIESTGNALWVSPLSFVEASTPGTGGFVETPNQRLESNTSSPLPLLSSSPTLCRHSRSAADHDVANVTEDHRSSVTPVLTAPSLMPSRTIPRRQYGSGHT
jgi:multidrug efflux pump subunit AcrB